MEKIKRRSIKTACSLLLSLLLVLSGMPLEGVGKAFAAPTDLKLTHFDFVQTNDKGNTNVEVTIQGSGFIQEKKSVINDILVRNGVSVRSLMQGEAPEKGVKVEVTDSIIKIRAPKTGDFASLNINTNVKNTITIVTEGLTTNNYSFDVQIDNLPSMPGNLENKKNYVGQKLVINGQNFTGVISVVIAEASHSASSGMTIDNKNQITINPLGKGTLNKEEKIQFIKEDSTSNTTTPIPEYLKQTDPNKKFQIHFTAEYLNRIIVFEKLPGMDNLRVLPSEGPYNRPSKITVQAMDSSAPGSTVKKGVFKNTSKLFLRRTKNGKEMELQLTDVKLVHENPENDASPVVAIEGYTPPGEHEPNSNWDLVIREDNVPNSEGIARKAFTFVAGDHAPQIESLEPSEGPNTGGTDVLIKGKNLFNVRTPGLEIPNAVKIVPKGNAKKQGNQTLTVEYTVPGGVLYGGKPVTAVKRTIKVRIASMTNAREGEIKILPAVPKTGDVIGGKKYGEFHYMTDSGDGLLVTTTNSGTEGPQEVLLDMETEFTVGGQKIIIPEGAKYTPFTYNEKNPTPKVDSVELEYGYPNDSEEEEEPPGAADGIKPLMIRIKGQKFEVYRDEKGTMRYPSVRFTLPDGSVLPVKSSKEEGDTKVLNSQGNPVDGIYNKTGDTLVISVYPENKSGLRDLIRRQDEKIGAYKELKAIVQVINPSGNPSPSNIDAAKFNFRRPKEDSSTDRHSKQPKITSVTHNGAPVKKLASDADSEIEIKARATAGISDLKKTKVIVDGLDISRNITKTERRGEDEIFNVRIPKGFVGKTRLQLIVPEGLMDSYQLIFDSVRGPEIKELIPASGDKGTFVVIKRDTQANTVGFKVPLPDSKNEEERIGSRVLWNGQDISELFEGYQKDGSGKVIYQKVDDFKNFKQKDKTAAAESVSLPSKYVYVVDADTIYLKIPESDSLKEAPYKIQIKNPDGSESSRAVIFTVINTIDKTVIGDITPNSDDIKGGIVVTITAGKDSGGRQTNFKGGADVYFGSQKAEVVGYDPEYKEIYVKVPPLVDFQFPDGLEETIDSYTVPVTVQNKVNKSTDTKPDGFIYLNPAYNVKITDIYNQKYSADPKNPDANKGVEGDIVVIRGENFRLKTGPDGKYILPKVMFGYATAEAPTEFGAKNVKPDGTPGTDSEGRAELEWIKVKVPKRPHNMDADGSVTILVQNPDGAKDTKDKGFFYHQNKPTINQKSSMLRASRFTDNIVIAAKDIVEQGLTVAFGEEDKMRYEKEHSSSQMELETSNNVEKIIVSYIPNSAGEDIAIYYKKGNEKILMKDTLNTKEGKLKLPAIGEKAVVGLNWKNPAYHSTNIVANAGLLARLNTEYMEIYIERKTPNINVLVVRRGLGKVTGSSKDDKSGDVKLSVDTPYYEKSEKTIVTLINADSSYAQAPFEFHGGLDKPIIKDVKRSKEDSASAGKVPKVKLFTQDMRVEGEMDIIGEHFKDVEYVRIGDQNLEILSVAPDYKSIRVKIPPGNESLLGKRMPIVISTKEGNAVSDQPVGDNPVIYFMYTKPESEPVIDTVTPEMGPRTGGTYIKIEGKGFRETDEFGVKGSIVIIIGGTEVKPRELRRNQQGEITEIHVTAPAAQTGKAKVQVKNADGALSPEKEFTYISQPVITKAGDAVFFNDAETEVTLTVEDLQEGAEVIIGAEMKKGLAKGEKKPQNVTAEGMLGVRNGENLTAYVIGGQKAKDVKVSKEKGTLSFKLPAGIEELEKMSVIIRNPDSGISEPKDNIIKPPIPDTPIIYAEPGAEGSVVLSWKVDLQALNAAEKFEVYAKLSSDSEYTFVGDTKQDTPDQAYIVKGLEHGTSYDFKVRVLNKYGEAKDLGYVRGFTLSASNDYKQQEKQAAADRAIEKIQTEGKQEIVGTTLRYTVGTAQTAVDFTKNGKYKEKQLQIPVRDILTNRGKVLFVTDGKINLQLSHAALSVPELSKASEDAFLRVSFSQPDKKKEDALRSAIGRKSTRLSPIYKLDFELVEPKKTLKIKQLAGTISIGFPAGEAGYPAEYMDRNDRFERLSGTAISKGGYYVLLKDKNK